MNAGFVSSLITDMPEGVSEMYFHPCITPCAEYSRWMPGYNPEEELGVLTDRGKIGELLHSNSIRLADYTVLRETNPA